MVVIDTNRLKGNYAQAIVCSWLSRRCLVRSVAEGTDIGVDLYCESVLEDQPFLHFWVQVKAIPSNNIRTVDGKEEARYSFDRRHLEYWDRQPIPVYAFLVPVTTWPPSQPEKIYGINITRNLVVEGLPENGSVTYRASDSFEAETIDADLQQFITKIVPADTALLFLKKGIVAPLPKSDPDFDDEFPIGIGWQHLPKILDNMRNASVQGLVYSLIAENKGKDWKPFRNQFEAIANLFEEQMHDFGISMLVRAAEHDGDIEKAKGYIYRAIDRIFEDQCLSADAKSTRLSKMRTLLEDFK